MVTGIRVPRILALMTALAAATVMTAAPAAMADETPQPASSTDYVLPPEVSVKTHTSTCIDNAPYLVYEVDAKNTTRTTVDITWVNPSGKDVVFKDHPLSGRILWPGAKLDANGKAIGWPGWWERDNSWQQGGSFTWARQPVQVKFAMDVTDVVTVAYPPDEENCLPPLPPNPPVSETTKPPATTTTVPAAPVSDSTAPAPSGSCAEVNGSTSGSGSVPASCATMTNTAEAQGPSGPLATTGAKVAATAIAALVLMGLGTAMVIARRRSTAPKM